MLIIIDRDRVHLLIALLALLAASLVSFRAFGTEAVPTGCARFGLGQQIEALVAQQVRLGCFKRILDLVDKVLDLLSGFVQILNSLFDQGWVRIFQILLCQLKLGLQLLGGFEILADHLLFLLDFFVEGLNFSLELEALLLVLLALILKVIYLGLLAQNFQVQPVDLLLVVADLLAETL